MKKAFVSWSGGKESSIACYKALSDGIEISYLLNMVTNDTKHSMTHGISSKLLYVQSECIGIPIVQKKTTWDEYEEDFKTAVKNLKQEAIEAGIFGDIDLQRHRDWVEKVCNDSKIEPILPLWGLKREEILEDFLKEGFEAFLVCAKADLFDEKWIGHKIDEEFLEYLQKKNIDLCGEGGEYHTFVTNGPIFKSKIKIVESKKVKNKEYWFLRIMKYEIMEKNSKEGK